MKMKCLDSALGCLCETTGPFLVVSGDMMVRLDRKMADISEGGAGMGVCEVVWEGDYRTVCGGVFYFLSR